MRPLRSRFAVYLSGLAALGALVASIAAAAAGAGVEPAKRQAAGKPRAAPGAPAATLRLAGVAEPRPRLVVLISIDQFRADYLSRFVDLYLPPASPPASRGGGAPAGVGGFRYLMERGAYFSDAHHDHYPLFTGPGHSVLLTGAPPYKSGIVGNSWFDRTLGRRRYCVEDPDSPLVGVAAQRTGPPRPSISPATLKVSTLGDELKMATGGRAKVWGLALKDRAAVLMAGRLADGVLWFDDETGAWISSKFYRPQGTLPEWVAKLNAQHPVDAYFGKKWLPAVPEAALARLWTPASRYANAPSALGTGFPHLVNGGSRQSGKDFYTAFATTPFGNELVLDTARELVANEKLGQGAAPDLLAINLSSNDYIGHAFGPDSAEVLDVSVRTDRLLSAFFNFLDHAVPGGLASVTLVVTADHGVVALPGALKEANFPAGSYSEDEVKSAAAKALADVLGKGEWVEDLVESNLYLNLASLKTKGVPRIRAEEIAAAAVAGLPGIYAAYTRSQIVAGNLPRTDIGRRVERSFHPKVSGDLVLVSDPFWVPGKLTGTAHGTPYAYDTSVPLLLAGAGIRPGRYRDRVSTLDIAPTLADLLGVLQPAGNEGRVLGVALR
ncbi:MAG TPA: alkaline phosphatase family protein [Thermoanaerobaculia bacterium]|nr:alkaline phosphatase family protein [Thermoanaerobaculia bacterium]